MKSFTYELPLLLSGVMLNNLLNICEHLYGKDSCAFSFTLESMSRIYTVAEYGPVFSAHNLA